MTKLGAVLHALVLVAFATALASCGRSDIGNAGGGGSGPTSCQSNQDCAGTPSTPYCELPQGVCVACLTSPDTCPAGETCDPTTHTCVPGPTGCTSDAQCQAPTPHCDVDTGQCVECVSDPQCPTGDACHNFHCVPSCGGGAACSGGTSCCGSICVDESSDPTNCGQCGFVCGPFPHATAACNADNCGIGKCAPGFADCDHISSDGCEVDTDTDLLNCGACGHACQPGDTCSGGTCLGPCGPDGSCTGGTTCCGMTCANTQSDPNNCGFCGDVCQPVGSSRVDLQACKLEYSIVSPK